MKIDAKTAKRQLEGLMFTTEHGNTRPMLAKLRKLAAENALPPELIAPPNPRKR
jgi:hypothetical protein